MSVVIEPFDIHMDDADLEDLRSRLARTRFPDQIAATGWEAGISMDYLRDLVGYWMDGYDWRREEVRLNGLDHFRSRIDGQSIHFVHVRSPHPDAMPLLLTHGWPGSFVEFLDVVPRLTDPPAFGGRTADAFHLVVPSLPGYAFSEPPRTPGWDVRRIAEAFIGLMARRARSGALRRHPSQHAGRDQTGRARSAHRRGAGRPGRHGAVHPP
jgi:Epoxide hydrolase N terminus